VRHALLGAEAQQLTGKTDGATGGVPMCRLAIEGATVSAPANGNLIYVVPWGNLGFYYNAERWDRAYDDWVIPIGTVEAGDERLDDLETGPVSVELIEEG
jgi:hypothetical protein